MDLFHILDFNLERKQFNIATEFVDLEKYKISRYNEEKNKYFYYQENFKWYFSIDGEIYDELIKWYYDKMDWTYEGMSPKDFLIIRINRVDNGDIIIYDNKDDRYIRFKIYKIEEKCLNKDTPKINIKRLFLKNTIRKTNYFIDVEKTKKYTRFDKEDGVVSQYNRSKTIRYWKILFIQY